MIAKRNSSQSYEFIKKKRSHCAKICTVCMIHLALEASVKSLGYGFSKMLKKPLWVLIQLLVLGIYKYICLCVSVHSCKKERHLNVV